MVHEPRLEKDDDGASPGKVQQGGSRPTSFRRSDKPTKPGPPTYRMMRDAGSAVCEVAVLFGLKQRESIEAVKHTTVLMLPKESMSLLSKQFPDCLDKIRRQVRLRLMHDNDVESLDQIAKLHDAKTQQQIAQLSDCFFAAAAGEMDVVRQALAEGLVDKHDVDFEQRTLLHIAAAAGQHALVKVLVDEFRVALNRRDLFGKTALGNALTRGHVPVAEELCEAGAVLGWDEAEVAATLCEKARQGLLPELKLLIRCGAGVNSVDYDSRSALHVAASAGHMLVIDYLLDAGADANAVDASGGTPLRDAVRRGNPLAAKLLYDRGGRLHYSEAEASAELCELARMGKLDRLRLMIECGAPISAADYDSRTALHLAATVGNPAIVSWLVKSGAAVNARDRSGDTPLSDAIKNAHGDVADTIRKHGGELGYDEAIRRTKAVWSDPITVKPPGKMDILEQLVRNGAEVNAKDYDQRTAIHLASSEGNKPIVNFLIQHGADVNARDRWGGTPLRDAVRHGHKTVAELLCANGAKLGFTNVEVACELCDLSKAGSLDRLMLMVASGAEVNASDYDRRTALHIAASEGNRPCLEGLISLGARSMVRDWEAAGSTARHHGLLPPRLGLPAATQRSPEANASHSLATARPCCG